MTVMSATVAQKNFYRLMSEVNRGNTPVTILGSQGKNAVLLSEDEWNSIQETLYLSSIPGMVDSIIKAGEEPSSMCSKYVPDEEW